MVKNTHGGNKSKGFARKNTVRRDTGLRVAEEEGEIYAQAIKVMGGSIVSAIDIDGNPLRGHIRGKFRGRGKRDNFIGEGTWLLVGLHAWESGKSSATEIRNCDILEVYSEIDKQRLKTSITSVNWNRFISNDNKLYSADTEEKDCGFTFADDTTQEYEELISSKIENRGATSAVIMEDAEEINVEDI
jgi:hypothetical protein